MNDDMLKKALRDDPRYKHLLDALPEKEREGLEKYLLSFMRQFYDGMSSLPIKRNDN